MNENEIIEEITGENVSEELEKEVQTYQSILSYEASIKKIDEFTKWIFSASSIVAALGAGFSSVYFNNLEGISILLFGISILLINFVLSLSAFAYAPIIFTYNPNKINILKYIIEKYLIRRRGLQIRIAGILFALAILLAGLSPLITKVLYNKSSLNVNYEYLNNSKVKISFSGQKLKPNSQLAINMFIVKNKKSVKIASLNSTIAVGGHYEKELLFNKMDDLLSSDTLNIDCTLLYNNSIKSDTTYSLYLK